MGIRSAMRRDSLGWRSQEADESLCADDLEETCCETRLFVWKDEYMSVARCSAVDLTRHIYCIRVND